ncbi:MAG: hypothetical protein EPO37_01480 [Nitrosarchaeum sp.]|nr:MAG: hypothetical protein EPO37_01480 [Nitrosarchaeum sp.]
MTFTYSQIWQAGNKSNQGVNENKMKEKFSISVDEELLKWLDLQIKERTFASRSHGIEFALNELKKKKS